MKMLVLLALVVSMVSCKPIPEKPNSCCKSYAAGLVRRCKCSPCNGPTESCKSCSQR